jgi:hypothetical protein
VLGLRGNGEIVVNIYHYGVAWSDRQISTAFGCCCETATYLDMEINACG